VGQCWHQLRAATALVQQQFKVDVVGLSLCLFNFSSLPFVPLLQGKPAAASACCRAHPGADGALALCWQLPECHLLADGGAFFVQHQLPAHWSAKGGSWRACCVQRQRLCQQMQAAVGGLVAMERRVMPLLFSCPQLLGGATHCCCRGHLPSSSVLLCLGCSHC